MGAVMPSSKLLARTMAQYVDVDSTGPVVELGPGTGAITNALIEHGVDQKRLVLVEYNPSFCALLRDRYPQAKVAQTADDKALDEYLRLVYRAASVDQTVATAIVRVINLLDTPALLLEPTMLARVMEFARVSSRPTHPDWRNGTHRPASHVSGATRC